MRIGVCERPKGEKEELEARDQVTEEQRLTKKGGLEGMKPSGEA